MSDVSCDAPGIETRPLTGDRWLLVGSSLSGGSAYSVLERFFHGCAQAFGLQIPEKDMYSVMETMGRRGIERELFFSTAFQGTRENPNLRGFISRLRADNFTPENLIRSALEGIVGELYGYYRSIQSATGIHANKITASGNALRRSLLLREICSWTYLQKGYMRWAGLSITALAPQTNHTILPASFPWYGYIPKLLLHEFTDPGRGGQNICIRQNRQPLPGEIRADCSGLNLIRCHWMSGFHSWCSSENRGVGVYLFENCSCLINSDLAYDASASADTKPYQSLSVPIGTTFTPSVRVYAISVPVITMSRSGFRRGT